MERKSENTNRFLPAEVSAENFGKFERYIKKCAEILFADVTKGRYTEKADITDFIKMDFKLGDVTTDGFCKDVTCYTRSLVNGVEAAFSYSLNKPCNTYKTFVVKTMDQFIQRFFDVAGKFLISGDTDIIESEEAFARAVYLKAVISFEEFITTEIGTDVLLLKSLALETYEKRSNKNAEIIFLNGNCDGIETVRCCSVELNLRNKREIRKLLEMTDENYALVAKANDDKATILGLVKKSAELYNKQCYRWRVSGAGAWEMLFSSQYIAGNKNNVYQSFFREIKDIECFSSDEDKRLLKIIGDGQSKFPHGGILIVFYDERALENEIKRLTKKNCGYEAKNIGDQSSELVKNMSSVDGAVFINGNTGEIAAMGMILDGKTDCEGNRARGSRYNSTRNYLYSLENCSIKAFVFSEDGGMDEIRYEHGAE